ncbi:unnamed protein product [Phyllotreta striolata]|uniref:Membrane protein BRI3 n=1 Tax=Phyllotreta striolata TaxID=444603 RepID=A0A9N9THV1_PHYSR|nr:unnamed protein product [Phyllotreta striolata]
MDNNPPQVVVVSPAPSRIPPGSCPMCYNTNWSTTFTCCGWCWLFLCFPFGIICCCCLRKKKCSKCGFMVN